MTGRGFSENLAHYLPPTGDIIRAGMTTGLVVFDTNVLLNLYRFASSARNELLSAFEKLGGRIWIPHQVALEFHRNRPEVLFEYGAAYKAVLDAVATHEDTVHADLSGKILQLANRIALPEKQRASLLHQVDELFASLRSRLERLRDSHGISQSLAKDQILLRLQKIFDGKTGNPLTEEDEAEALAEADRRHKASIPPGYKDKGPGDYILWRQTLDEARSRSEIHVLVFVTEDTKEDWYLRVKGRVIGARPELVAEASKYAGVSLVMMRTDTFLRYSAEHLRATVSEDTIRQAKELPEVGALSRIERLQAQTMMLRGQRDSLADQYQSTKMRHAEVLHRVYKLRASEPEASPSDDRLRDDLAELAKLEKLQVDLTAEMDALDVARAKTEEEFISLAAQVRSERKRLAQE